MAKCPKCGKELPPDGGTCEYCTVDLRRKRHSTRFKRFEDAVDAPPEPAPAPEPQAPDETEDDEDEGERTFVLKHGAIQEPAEIEEPAGPSGEEGLLPASALQEEPPTQRTVLFSEAPELAGGTPEETEDLDPNARAEYEEALGTIILDDEEGIAEAVAEVVADQAVPERLGPYRVVRLLGRGGMGAVYEGWDESLSRRVAIKLLAPEHTASTEFDERFLEEAKTIAKLSHPNVVQVYFAGEEAGRHFFAMEFVEGESLYDLVRRDGPLGPRRALGYVLQAAAGLQAAFQAGIIHRDVKPANLMLAPGENVKVADFGLAMARTAGTEDSGEIAGSPHYMSPEQGQGLAVDHRSDIYSLGATLFFLLTGAPPFRSDDPIEVIYKHVSDPLPKIPHSPYGLDRFFNIIMAKTPEKRQGDYERLIKDLNKLHGSGLPVAPLVETGWEAPEPQAAPDTATETLKDFEDAEGKAETEDMSRLLSDLDEIMGDEDR